MQNDKKGFQLIELDPVNLEIHSLANNNPMMPEDQYKEFGEQFTKGFDRNISHVVLYKGKVVDGRHRCRICIELGFKVWVRNLPGTMSLEEVEEFVEGTENRRHQTPTQRAIGAYKYYLLKQIAGTPVSQSVAASHKLSTRKQLARAATLHELIGDELLTILHNGGKLLAKNPKSGVEMPTDALVTLINYFTIRNEGLIVLTKVTSDLTDTEVALAMTKFNDLQLECTPLVLKQISKLIHHATKEE